MRDFSRGVGTPQRPRALQRRPRGCGLGLWVVELTLVPGARDALTYGGQ
jgi:hypothetical protein